MNSTMVLSKSQSDQIREYIISQLITRHNGIMNEGIRYTIIHKGESNEKEHKERRK